MLELRWDTSGHETTAKSASVPTAFPQDQRVAGNLVSLRVLRLAGKWSGRWESNPRGRRCRANASAVVVCQLGPLLGTLARLCAAGLYADIARCIHKLQILLKFDNFANIDIIGHESD